MLGSRAGDVTVTEQQSQDMARPKDVPRRRRCGAADRAKPARRHGRPRWPALAGVDPRRSESRRAGRPTRAAGPVAPRRSARPRRPGRGALDALPPSAPPITLPPAGVPRGVLQELNGRGQAVSAGEARQGAGAPDQRQQRLQLGAVVRP